MVVHTWPQHWKTEAGGLLMQGKPQPQRFEDVVSKHNTRQNKQKKQNHKTKPTQTNNHKIKPIQQSNMLHTPVYMVKIWEGEKVIKDPSQNRGDSSRVNSRHTIQAGLEFLTILLQPCRGGSPNLCLLVLLVI